MDLKSMAEKISSNRLSYDEALRVAGYLEKQGVSFDKEVFLEKCLTQSFTPEDGEEFKTISFLIPKQPQASFNQKSFVEEELEEPQRRRHKHSWKRETS